MVTIEERWLLGLRAMTLPKLKISGWGLSKMMYKEDVV